MALMPTDLPEPGVPAIRRCGMRDKSAMTGVPPMSLPSVKFRPLEARSNCAEDNSSRRHTSSRRALGSSMPMTLRPDTTAMRTDTALMERAMSSARPMTRLVLVPGAGSSSFRVTTGPGRIFTISPRIPKSSSTDSKSLAFFDRASSCTRGVREALASGGDRSSSGGSS